MVFSEDGLSAIATKLGTHLMLVSYTYVMYAESWGRSSYVRPISELRSYVELKDTIMVVVPKLVGEGFSVCTIRIEYDWKLPRCSSYKVFCHVLDECPKKIILGMLKNLKNPRQVVRRVKVGSKLGFKPTKQVYLRVAKNNGASASGKKKQAGLTIQEGTNDRNSKLAENGANDVVASSYETSFEAFVSPTTTPLAESINDLE
ncbi:hypothetical protein Tco_0675092 [Tanacetum coccineum]